MPMKLSFFTTLLYTSLFIFPNATPYSVDELTDKEFDNKIGKPEVALVFFYAPWCGHCQKFSPEFNEAADKLQTDYPNISLMKVDCTSDGKNVCEQNAITAYPTLKIYRNGRYFKEYDGEMNANDIVDYMKAQIGPSSKELQNHDDFNRFLNVGQDSVSLVGFFETDNNLKTAYMNIADEMRGKCRFAHTSDKDLIKRHGIRNGVVMFQPAFLWNKYKIHSTTFNNTINSYNFIENRNICPLHREPIELNKMKGNYIFLEIYSILYNNI